MGLNKTSLVIWMISVGVALVGASTTKVLLQPSPRIQIPSEFAKSYWISGSYFNNANFKGLPPSFYGSEPKCVNLVTKEEKNVKPTSECVMLFKEKNCQGAYQMGDDTTTIMDVNSMKSCHPLDDSWRIDSRSRSPVREYVDPTEVGSGEDEGEELLVVPQGDETDKPSYKVVDFGGDNTDKKIDS